MTTMRDDTKQEIISSLKRDYHFKAKSGSLKMHGMCPHCRDKNHEAYVFINDPWTIICPRDNNCGVKTSTRELYPSAFTQYSTKHPPTKKNPKATADAYLQNGRSLPLAPWKDTYTQELWQDYKTNATCPTIRFAIKKDDKQVTYWERLIEPPKGIKKGRFEYQGEYKGLAWYPPKLDPCNGQSVLGLVKEIWLVEGIFDAMALTENGIHAIATLTSGNFPTHTLKEITERMQKLGAAKPKLVLAFDNDPAGRNATLKLMPIAKQKGYEVSAVQTTQWANGKQDWNDIHARTIQDHYSNNSNKFNGFSKESLDTYRYNGALLTAETARDKALLIHNKYSKRKFPMFFGYCTYWVIVDVDAYTRAMTDDDNLMNEPEEPKPDDYIKSGVTQEDGLKTFEDAKREYKQAHTLWKDDIIQNHIEVIQMMNCQPQALYYQQNEVTDESWYFFRILKPSTKKHDPLAKPIDHKNTFTGGQLSTGSEFKKRLLSVAPGVIYTGDSNQLNKMLENMINGIKTVQTIDYIGYSDTHQTYVFNDTAVQHGRVFKINKDDFFDLPQQKSLKTLAASPRITIADKPNQQIDWLGDIITGWGVQGIIALAGFMGSLFAQQIRSNQKSYPFLEIVGDPGTGKSTLLSFFWRLIGRDGYEGIDPNKTTKAGRLRALSQTSNMPSVFIESDRDNAGGGRNTQFNWDELKNLYDGGTIGTRGIKSAGNEVYEPPFRGTIIISQNLPVMASKAVLSRICHMFFSSEQQTQAGETAARRIEALGTEQLSHFLIQMLQAEKQFMDIFCQTKPQAESWLKSKGVKNFRVAHCHAQLIALVDALANTTLPKLKDYKAEVEDHIFAMAQERDKTMDSEHPLNIQFFDTLVALNTPPREMGKYWMQRLHINHSNQPDQLAINMTEIYKLAREQSYDLPPQQEMQHALRQSRQFKFLEANKVVQSRHSKKSMRCWIFQKPKDIEIT